jgi:hypothetical protein
MADKLDKIRLMGLRQHDERYGMAHQSGVQYNKPTKY